MDGGTFIAIAIGFLIWIAIMHEIIRSAVKSGTRRQTRLLIMRMVQEGKDPEQIKSVLDLDEKDFWMTFNVKK